MKPNVLFVIATLFFGMNLIHAGAIIPADRCGALLDSPGVVTLNHDSNSSVYYPSTSLLTNACFLITSSNVTLDCAGHKLTNNVTGNTTGILIEGNSSNLLTNITIINCQVSNFTWGVYAYYTNSSTILNNTAKLSTNIGFTAHNSSSVNFTNNTARNSPAGEGFVLYNSSYSTLNNNTAYSNYGEGFYMFNSSYNTLTNNTAYNDSEGFVLRFSSSNNTLQNNTAHATTDMGFYCDVTADRNNLTGNSAYNNSIGFFLLASYNNLVKNTAGNNTWGFIADRGSTGNNFTNCTAYGSYWHGFLAEFGANGNNFVNDISYGNKYEGFYMAGSDYNTLISNTAYNNNENGFFVGNGSAYTMLTNNTAYDNKYDGFNIFDSNSNNLTGNLYNQSPYHIGLLRYGEGFYLQNATNNNLVNNTAVNSYETGFYTYNSSYNSFINNTAINNSWDGFILDSSFNNSFTNNFAYLNQQFGFEVYLSSGNNITNNTLQESGEFDLYIDSLSWSDFLNFTQSSTAFCNNIIQNLTGSGGRPINYSNTPVNWNGITASEIVLCHADGSNLTNVTIRGSDSIQNNGLIMSSTSNTVVDSSNSSRNLVGFAALLSTNSNFTNNIADENLFAGFADIVGAGNRFANSLESDSLDGGFFVFLSNDSVYTNNTAHGNSMAGFAIIQGSNNTHLTNNTVYNTSQVGTIVDSSDFTMISGDHYYANGVDFAVNTTVSLAPLNLSGVIFDNPLGNYESYTNLSLNDIVQPDEFYSITWTTKPAAGDPPSELSFHGKFVNIQTSPGAVIDNIIWHWTDEEAAGIDENTLSVMQYSNSAWMGIPGQSLLDPAQNYISVSNLFSFGTFGMFKQAILTPPTGGGGGCSSNLKLSVEGTICPDNRVVILLADSYGKLVGAGVLVTLKGLSQLLVEHTNSTGEVSFAIPTSGRYTAGGIACDRSFDYNACPAIPAGCTSDAACADDQYCDSSGACKPVECSCGQSYAHSCHPYACCVDSDCNSSYACVDHQCKSATKPECTVNDDCRYDEYCSAGKCLHVQVGKCGEISNHAWRDYECCNDSDCPPSSVCKDNACTQVYTITTNPTGSVGESHQVKVVPSGEYNLSVVAPNGQEKTIRTDQSGNAVFVLENSGTYTVYLLKDETTNASVEVNAVNNTPTLEKPVVQQDFTSIIAIIVLVLVVVIVSVLYLLSRGRRRD